MAGAYSQPYQYDKYHEQYPVELISKTFMYQQGKYDANRAKVQDFLDSFSSVDLLKEEDKAHFATNLNTLLQSVNKAGGGNLTRDGVADQLIGNIGQAADETVVNGYVGTQQARQYMAEAEKIKKDDPDKFNDANYQYGLLNVNSWMTDEKAGTKLSSYKNDWNGAGIGQFNPYRNTVKELQDAISKEKPDVRVTLTPHGKYQFFRGKTEVLGDDIIKGIVDLKMQDSGFAEQTKINAWSTYGQLDSKTLTPIVTKNLSDKAESLRKMKEDIQKEIITASGDKKEELKNREKEIIAAYTDVNSRLQNLPTEVEDKKVEYSKMLYNEEVTSKMVKVYAKNNLVAIDMLTDDEKKEVFKHGLDKDLKTHEADLKAKGDLFMKTVDAWGKGDVQAANTYDFVNTLLGGQAVVGILKANETKLNPQPITAEGALAPYKALEEREKTLVNTMKVKGGSDVSMVNYDSKLKEAEDVLRSETKGSVTYTIAEEKVRNLKEWNSAQLQLLSIREEKETLATSYTEAAMTGLYKGETIDLGNGVQVFLDKSDNKIKKVQTPTIETTAKGLYNSPSTEAFTKGFGIVTGYGAGVVANVWDRVSNAVSGEGGKPRTVTEVADSWAKGLYDMVMLQDDKGEVISGGATEYLVGKVRRKVFTVNGDLTKGDLLEVMAEATAKNPKVMADLAAKFNAENSSPVILDRPQQLKLDASVAGYNLTQKLAAAGVNIPTEIKENLSSFTKYSEVAPKYGGAVDFTTGGGASISFSTEDKPEERTIENISHVKNIGELETIKQAVQNSRANVDLEYELRGMFLTAKKSKAPATSPIEVLIDNKPTKVGDYVFQIKNTKEVIIPTYDAKVLGITPIIVEYERNKDEPYTVFFDRVRGQINENFRKK